MPMSVGTAYITILPDTNRFTATLVAQMKTASDAVSNAANDAARSSIKWDALGSSVANVGDNATAASVSVSLGGRAANDAGGKALGASIDWNAMGDAIAGAGARAVASSGDYVILGGAVNYAEGQVQDLNSTLGQMQIASDAVNSAAGEAARSSVQWDVLGSAVADVGDQAISSSASVSIGGTAAGDAGDTALGASINWTAMGAAIAGAGANAVTSSGDFVAMGASVNYAEQQVQDLNGALERSALIRGGGIGGGPPGKGVATDIGSAFRGATNIAQGFVGVLLLIAPTINIIISALVGVIGLLTSAAAAAVAFAAALGATAAVMALAAFKWRDLLVQSQQGAETWRGAFLAIEAEAFNMSKAVIDSFSKAGKSGKDFWTTIGEAGVKGLHAMQPVIDWIVSHIKNFIDALNGVGGASSPFLDFLRTWLIEWKVLGQIINAGIQGGGGLLGFFAKYEKPAKAFVEGIAQVINGIRKMSAMGLGLNMDQLAELIRNVFTWLAQMVQIFPKFSNSLVAVGLQLTKFLNEMLPLIQAAIELGSAILEHIVAPLVDGLLVALSAVVNAPFIKYFFELAGAVVVVAVAISKLSFGLVPFNKIMLLVGQGLIWLANVAGAAVLKMLPQLSAEMFATMAPFVGAVVIIAAVGAAFLLLKGPLAQVGAMSQHTADVFKASMASMVAGTKTGTQVLAETYLAAADSFNQLSNIGKIIFGVQHFSDALKGTSVTAILTQEALDKLKGAYASLSDELATAVVTGGFTDAQQTTLDALRADFVKIQEIGNTLTLPTGTTADGARQIISDYNQMALGAQAWSDTLAATNAAFADGSINAGQYATELTQLYGTEKLAAEQVNLTALKVKGASLTISQALLEVQKSGDTATGALAQFAAASGQSFSSLRATALTAMNDVQGGLLGTGAKVTEFFQSQADAITSWQEQTATAFELTSQVFTNLAGTAKLSADSIVNSLKTALDQMMSYTHNFNALEAKGFSDKALQQIIAAGPAAANVVAGLATATKKQVDQVNHIVAQGGDIAKAFAIDASAAIGLTMDRLAAAMEVMVSKSLGIPLARVQGMVDKAVSGANASTTKLKDRVINITMKQRVSGKAAGFAPGPGGSPAFAATKASAAAAVPKPDIAAIKAAWVPAGVAMDQGTQQGIATGTAGVSAAVTRLGAQTIAAMRKAIGANSPATKFVEIGRDAVSGLIDGVSKMTGTLVGQMMRTGNAMAAGMRSGLLNGLANLKSEAVSAALDIAAAVKDAMKSKSPSLVFMDIGKNMSDGLRLGLLGGMTGIGKEAADSALKIATAVSSVKLRVDPLSGDTPGRRITRDTRDKGRGGDKVLAGVASRQASGISGELRVTDWRNGLASLDGEIGWEDAVRNR